MSRNVVIFSDGTGQAGGFRFDEKRSDIYKMYRAMRNGPDSSVDPAEQAAFYDPGLGSEADGGRLFGGFARWIYNTVSQATGLGITANMIDCYAALIRLWRPGDRIFLFGFSRGAYTIRCLAGVIAQCGIPTRLSETQPLKYDEESVHALASKAVKNVYQFTESRPRATVTPRQKFLLETRGKIAARFRKDHACGDDERTNVYPHFIGVFDTVAALTNAAKTIGLAAAFLALTALISLTLSYLSYFPDAPLIGGVLGLLSFKWVFGSLVILEVLLASGVYLRSHVKFDFSVSGHSSAQRRATIHLNELWQKFYDYELNEHVVYAKHALSIDENRMDFPRVKWNPSTKKPGGAHDEYGNIFFEQVWFSGNHSDIGGSYQETESRLSDISMHWMLECATKIPEGLTYDPSVLKLFPNPLGMQHDEVKAGLGTWARVLHLTWPEGVRDPRVDAILHKSVYQRFDAREVLQFDCYGPYRPQALKEHKDLSPYYVATTSCSASSLAGATCLARQPTGNPAAQPVVVTAIAPPPLTGSSESL